MRRYHLESVDCEAASFGYCLPQVKTMLPSLGSMLKTAASTNYSSYPGFNTLNDADIHLVTVDAEGCD